MEWAICNECERRSTWSRRSTRPIRRETTEYKKLKMRWTAQRITLVGSSAVVGRKQKEVSEQTDQQNRQQDGHGREVKE